MLSAVNKGFSFGDFEVDAGKRLLLKDGEAVNLNPKAFDLLLVMVENHGRLLSKNELLDKVWEGQFVEENNLTVHIAALRKIFGEKKGDHRFIVTQPGRGYTFVAPVRQINLNDSAPDFERPFTKNSSFPTDDGPSEPASTKIVIERHKFSHIVIDEHLEADENDPAAVSAPEMKMVKETRGNPGKPAAAGFRVYSVAALATALALALFSGGYFWQQRQAKTPFVQASVRQLTTNGKVQIAALSPDGKLFAYTVTDLGLQSFWLGYTGGGNHILLRPAVNAVYYELDFSPDGDHLYFSTKGDQDAKSALYRMPAFGGAAAKVFDGVTTFALSPDGGRIAFSRAEKGRESLVIANLDGSEAREALSFERPRSMSGVIGDTISWSADGNRLAFRDADENGPFAYDIVLFDIASGVIERVQSKAWRDVRKTAWLRDGSGLIVSAVATDSWASVIQYRLFHVALASGETRELTTDRSTYDGLSVSADSDSLLSIEHRQLNNIWVAPVEDLSAARQITFSAFGKYDGLWGLDFTPDGRLIYTNSDTQSQFISEMKTDGSEQRQLTAPGLIDSVLNVSPDGRHIVFHSNRAGGFDVWRMNLDGTNAQQLTFGKLNFQPYVSADGRWVYYKSWECGTGELRRVALTGGEPEILNDKETSWVSFSPDGRYFAATHRTDKVRLAVFSAETNRIVKEFDIPRTGTFTFGSRWTPDSRAVVYRDSAYGYWMQPVEDGAPVRMEGLPHEKLYNFSFSRDGQQFAFVRGQEIRDVVLFRPIK